MSYYNNEPSGISFSGVILDPLASGSIDTGRFINGYGQVYGIYWNTGANVSYGLAKHTLTQNSAPTISGDIYWTAPSPFGNKIQLGFSGIKYLDPQSNRTFVDNSGILGIGNAMIADFEIKPIKSGLEDIVETSIAPSLFYLNGVKLGSINEGIFITNQRFNRTGNFYSGSSPNGQQTLSGLLNSLAVVNPLITGYVAYASGEGMQMFDGGGNFKSYMNGGILKTPIEKSDLYLKPFTVYIKPDKVYYGTGDFIDCWRVTDFFSNNQERMTDLKRRLEVSISNQSKYVTFFTGYDSGSNTGLYLTYIKGNKSFYCPAGTSLNYPSSCTTSVASGIFTNDNGLTGVCYRCKNCDPCPSGTFSTAGYSSNGDVNQTIASIYCSNPGYSVFSYVNDCGQTGNCLSCTDSRCENKGLYTDWLSAANSCSPLGKDIGSAPNAYQNQVFGMPYKADDTQWNWWRDGNTPIAYYCWECSKCDSCKNYLAYNIPFNPSTCSAGYAYIDVYSNIYNVCGPLSCGWCNDNGSFTWPPTGIPQPPYSCVDASTNIDTPVFTFCGTPAGLRSQADYYTAFSIHASTDYYYNTLQVTQDQFYALKLDKMIANCFADKYICVKAVDAGCGGSDSIFMDIYSWATLYDYNLNCV